jgi:hypothetical protein
VLRDVPYEGLFVRHRRCPHCRGRFAVDRRAMAAQGGFLVMTGVSLILTILLYRRGAHWLFPALISYVVTALIAWIGNRNLTLVRYQSQDFDAH